MRGINNFKLRFWAGDTYTVSVLKEKWPYKLVAIFEYFHHTLHGS